MSEQSDNKKYLEYINTENKNDEVKYKDKNYDKKMWQVS